MTKQFQSVTKLLLSCQLSPTYCQRFPKRSVRQWSGSCPITCSYDKYCKIWWSISRWAGPSGWNIARASHRWPPTATNLSPRASEKNTENSLKEEQKTKSWSLWEVIYYKSLNSYISYVYAKAKGKGKDKDKDKENDKFQIKVQESLGRMAWT